MHDVQWTGFDPNRVCFARVSYENTQETLVYSIDYNALDQRIYMIMEETVLFQSVIIKLIKRQFGSWEMFLHILYLLNLSNKNYNIILQTLSIKVL